jgi:hypothetical protein
MGLTNSQQGGSKVFLSISNGKLVRSFKEKTEGAVSRINKAGREVYEMFYDSLEGTITGVGTKESDYGKFLVVQVESNGVNYQLEMNFSSGYSASFLKTIPNVNLSTRVSITPKLTIEGDKKKSVCFLNQNGSGLKWAFTRENPNGMPDLVKIKVKGKDTWDDSDRMEFLENYAKNLFVGSNKMVADNDEVPF